MALSRLSFKHKSLANPPLSHLFSSSSSSSSPEGPPPSDQSVSEISTVSQSDCPPQQPRQQQPQNHSFSSDLKSSLRQQLQHHLQKPGQRNLQTNWNVRPNPTSKSTFSGKPVSKAASFEEIKKNLSEFRLRSSVPPATEPKSAPQISFLELYKRNVQPKSEDGSGGGGSGPSPSPSKPSHGTLSFDAIRESLRQMRPKNEDSKPGDAIPMSSFRTSLRLRSANEGESAKSTVIGGTGELPAAIFGKEMRRDEGRVEGETSMEFVRTYDYSELGEKLRKFRPDSKNRGKGWFSLEELNERLRKIREEETKEKEQAWKIGGISFKELRESLKGLKMADDERTKKNSVQRLNVLVPLNTMPNFMLHPPKDNLVEKYFHPDNISSAEKLKIELAKVRDEFKMSESDCGSARVQVAQLTTKIKHLSSVLHKKDKHSQRGLQAMTQKRKKLLKYLRRTDWDSYCFVISKLGLQDNPSYKTKLKVRN